MESTLSGNVNSSENLYQASANDLPVAQDQKDMISDGGHEATSIEAVKVSLRTRLKRLKLELVVFVFTFSYTMTKVSSTTMILDKVCLVNFGYSDDICRNLDNYTEIKSSVVKVTTNYQLGHTLIQNAPAALLACFIGPWSDNYGRKFPIFLALFGMMIDAVGSVVCAYYLKSRVEYYFIPAVFTGVFGGTVSILSIIYSYASDLSDFEIRTLKYAFVEMAAGFAMPLGSLVGGWIYKLLDYSAVFLFSSGGLCFCLIWFIFVMEETRGQERQETWSVKLNELFSCNSFKESFATIAKERPQKGKKQIVLLIVSFCFLIISFMSTGDIDFLYVHNRFTWDNTKYSTIVAIYSVIASVELLVLIPLFIRFRITDTKLGLIGTVCFLVKDIGIGLALKSGIYHAANIIGFIGPCAMFAVRSRISKLVSSDDLGKMFSFVATVESLLPILTSVLLTQIFTASLDVFSGIPYLLLAVFLIVPFIVFGWMTQLPQLKRDEKQYASMKGFDTSSAEPTRIL